MKVANTPGEGCKHSEKPALPRFGSEQRQVPAEPIRGDSRGSQPRRGGYLLTNQQLSDTGRKKTQPDLSRDDSLRHTCHGMKASLPLGGGTASLYLFIVAGHIFMIKFIALVHSWSPLTLHSCDIRVSSPRVKGPSRCCSGNSLACGLL